MGSESLEERIDQTISGWQTPPTKKKMFGGAGYMVNGNLAFGTHKKTELIVRAGEEKSSELLKDPNIRVFDMTGKPMKNWFIAGPEATTDDIRLLQLLETGKQYALSLPPK
jgi:TfoX/Sxy family transcriptional regulator of competence genes